MRIPTRALLATTTIAIAALLAGCSGGTAAPASGNAGRSVEVTMTDNAFQPTQLNVKKGETVTIRFKNTGTVKHEAILGDDATQMAHHAEMTASTVQMEHGSPKHEAAGSADATTVEPGKTGELTHTFNESGTLLIGCHEPGHWEAGMKATVNIT